MKISGKFILKVAGTLTIISLVVAALLGLVNNITADKIAAIDAENTKIAMSAVAPEGSEFFNIQSYRIYITSWNFIKEGKNSLRNKTCKDRSKNYREDSSDSD